MALTDLVRKLHIRKYVRSTILISAAGGLFGLDTGTIGPITSMPQFAQTFGVLSATVHGLVVSTILIPAAISSLFGGHLANSVGRIKAIAIGTAIFGIGASLECASVKLVMLIVGRAVKGVGEGLFLSTVVVWVAKCSPLDAFPPKQQVPIAQARLTLPIDTSPRYLHLSTEGL